MAKKKTKELKRKMKQSKPRIPVAPPGKRHKSKKDYKRKKLKVKDIIEE